jgi:hypothetical protein
MGLPQSGLQEGLEVIEERKEPCESRKTAPALHARKEPQLGNYHGNND